MTDILGARGLVLGRQPYWRDWSPTYTNLTVGNGTVTARYRLIHGMCEYLFAIQFGSTTTVDGVGVKMSYPFTAAGIYTSSMAHGIAYLRAGAISHPGFVRDNGADMEVLAFDTVATYVRQVQISATIPGTWTTNDILSMQGRYRVAGSGVLF